MQCVSGEGGWLKARLRVCNLDLGGVQSVQYSTWHLALGVGRRFVPLPHGCVCDEFARRDTTGPGLWTLDAGRWMLDAGRWAMVFNICWVVPLQTHVDAGARR